MPNRSMRAALIFAGTLVTGALTVPAFAQSYGAMPRGYCATQARAAQAPTTRYHQQSAYVSGDTMPARQTQRPRRARGLPSPF
jgi:hypothetical protein